MLSKISRIHKADFKSFGRPVTYHSPILSLSIYRKQDTSASQFSFSCSKKVAKSAVKRNALRRRGYACLEKRAHQVAPGYFYVFNFKKGAEGALLKDIQPQIESLFKKSGLIIA